MRDAIESKRDLFVSSFEVLETWRILDVVQKKWEKSEDDLVIYKKGSNFEEVAKLL